MPLSTAAIVSGDPAHRNASRVDFQASLTILVPPRSCPTRPLVRPREFRRQRTAHASRTPATLIRECHNDTGSCGRHDPCRVPFVVHAILAFRGADLASWHRHYEQGIASALQETINCGRHAKEYLLEVGNRQCRCAHGRPVVQQQGRR